MQLKVFKNVKTVHLLVKNVKIMKINVLYVLLGFLFNTQILLKLQTLAYNAIQLVKVV